MEPNQTPIEPKPARQPRKAAKRKVKTTEAPNEYAGMTTTTCPIACTAKRCVISTVDICKHPLLAPANGCGPVTLKNRDRALKMLKHQKIEKG